MWRLPVSVAPPARLAILLLAAAVASAAQGTVKARLVVPDNVKLPPQGAVHVMLLDVSRGDASSVMIAEKKAPLSGEDSLSFTLTYDRAKIDETHDYAVAARVTVDGRLRLMSDKKSVVITKGRPSTVEVKMKVVGRAAAPPAN